MINHPKTERNICLSCVHVFDLGLRDPDMHPIVATIQYLHNMF